MASSRARTPAGKTRKLHKLYKVLVMRGGRVSSLVLCSLEVIVDRFVEGIVLRKTVGEIRVKHHTTESIGLSGLGDGIREIVQVVKLQDEISTISATSQYL